MKHYVIFLLHSMIWSGYLLITWLSKRDHVEYKMILFLIFFYFAYACARKMFFSKKSAFFVTIFSLIIYYVFQNLFWVMV